jgi:hypothetical protein
MPHFVIGKRCLAFETFRAARIHTLERSVGSVRQHVCGELGFRHKRLAAVGLLANVLLDALVYFQVML